MEAARASVKNFMSRAGHHDTTVHERVAPAVTHETITKTHHEHRTTAIDREVHQDHYHTSIQPIHHEETLAEQHHHNLIPVEHRKFHHGDEEEVKRRLAEESAKHFDKVERVEGKRTSTIVPVVSGEHIHHHVHETIQPVIQKATVEPHIYHTTIPIHEVHHNKAHHHATSSLPAVTMDEFKKQGGVLTGREVREDGFAGEPRSVGKALGGAETVGTSNHGLMGNKLSHKEGSVDNTSYGRDSVGDRSSMDGQYAQREGSFEAKQREGLIPKIKSVMHKA